MASKDDGSSTFQIHVKCTEKMQGNNLYNFNLFLVYCRMDDEQRLNMMDDDRQHMMRGGRPGMDQVSVGGIYLCTTQTASS